jgi:hypothetical protein
MHIQGEEQVSFGIIGIGNAVIVQLVLMKGQVTVEDLQDVFLTHPFELEIADVETMLKHAKGKNVSISPEIINDEVEGMNVTITNTTTNDLEKEIEIPCFIVEQKIQTPKLDTTDYAKFNIPIKSLVDIIGEISEYNNQLLQIAITEKDDKTRLIFNTTDSLNLRKKITLMRIAGEDFEVQQFNEVKCKFQVDLIQFCIKTASASCYDMVQIVIGINKPLIIGYNKQVKEGEQDTIDNIENLNCYIAPAVDQERQ